MSFSFRGLAIVVLQTSIFALSNTSPFMNPICKCESRETAGSHENQRVKRDAWPIIIKFIFLFYVSCLFKNLLIMALHTIPSSASLRFFNRSHSTFQQTFTVASVFPFSISCKCHISSAVFPHCVSLRIQLELSDFKYEYCFHIP